MFLCAGIYTLNTILMTWVSGNVRPDSKRSAALPWFICIGNISGVVGSQIYPTFTGPRYIMGNSISLAMEFVAICGVGIIWVMLKRREREKSRLRSEGVRDNGRRDDKGLDFEYIF